MKWLKRHVRAWATRCMPMREGDEHDMPGRLVVSLTSYPARFPTLHLTLRSLLSQDMEPDAIIVWIAHQHIPLLPQRVLELQRYGMELRACDDLQSYKKIVPALRELPDAHILIADDDVFYPRGWLRRFVECYGNSREVLCQRGRRVQWDQPYDTWKLAAVGDRDVMPTGVGGVLYPAGSLPPQTTDQETFTRLCPTGDDLWLHCMASRHGCTHRMIGAVGEFTAWPGSQRCALWRRNKIGGENDRQIAAMMGAYGMPHFARAPEMTHPA